MKKQNGGVKGQEDWERSEGGGKAKWDLKDKTGPV